MKEETYLNISITLNELTYDIKKLIMTKLMEKYLFKEFNCKMITNINNFENIEMNILTNIDYKSYKEGDIIYGELYTNDNYKDDRVFVMSHDIICEILNTNILDKIKSRNHIKVCLSNIESTNGCFYFLASGNIYI